MKTHDKVWAVIPVKDFNKAKSRLGPVLTADECAALARNMAEDVVLATRAAVDVDGITLLGGNSEVEDLAAKLGCDYLEEFGDAGLSSNLNMAAKKLEKQGVRTLVIIPSDLPMLHSQDIGGLLAEAGEGLCVCPAGRDGGTNAIVITPPAAIQFCFGEESARRHLEAGEAAGLLSKEIELNAFSHDIDTPADLLWFCQQAIFGRTADFLDQSGIRAKLLAKDAAIPA